MPDAERVVLADGSRLSFGGDEFLLVELDEAMSLPVTLRVLAIADAVSQLGLAGLVDVCPAHVSYLLRVDPEALDPRKLAMMLGDVHRGIGDTHRLTIPSRVIELPVLYRDPWTVETLLRFRDRHQAPELDDLAYCARINGLEVDGLVQAHSEAPWIATFIGFVPGNAECYQLTAESRQLQTPKYLRPRTDTPARAVGHGGAFTTVYPVRGAGGFQLFGRSAAPVFDRDSTLTDFAGSPVLPRGGDIFKYRPVDRSEYDEVRRAVKSGTYRYRLSPVEFELARFHESPDSYTASLVGALS